MSRRLHAYFAVSVAAALGVAGQSSNVTQCIPTYNWSFNSKGQSPCLVAAYLETACGTPTSVDAIPAGTHYLGPRFAEADPCRCSSVTYSMVSACGGCQDRSFSNWTVWTQSCPSTSDTFPKPIPDATEVPAWAFLNLSLTGENFDPVVAAQIAGTTLPRTSSSTTPLPSDTSTQAPTTSPSTSSTSTPSAVASSGHTTNAGAIAGGVVGGLVFLALIILAFLWWYMRKRRDAVQKDVSFDSRALFAPTPVMSQNTTGITSQPTGPSAGVPMSLNGHEMYPSDIGTYPSSPMTSGVYTHLPGSTVRESRRSLDSVSPSVAQLGGGRSNQGHGHRGFTGAAELA